MAAELRVTARVEHALEDVWWALSTAAGLGCWQGERVRSILSDVGRSGFRLEWPCMGVTIPLVVQAAQAPRHIEFQGEAEHTIVHVDAGQVTVTYRGLAAVSDPVGLRASWRRALWQLNFALQFGRPRVRSYYRALLLDDVKLHPYLDQGTQEFQWLRPLLLGANLEGQQESFGVAGRELVVAGASSASLVSVRSLPSPDGAGCFVLLGWTGYTGQGCDCVQHVDAAAEALSTHLSGWLLPRARLP